MRTGRAELPLHGGKAPRWLFKRMVPLARGIVSVLVEEYGPLEALRRFSDPFWFQAFGCVLGFDWHSSGLTTTACGALKEGLKGTEKDLGIWVAGGKGGTSRKTPSEIMDACTAIGLDADPLVYASRMSAKVDSAAVQDGYQIYHHSFLFTSGGEWAVVQQGMNQENGMARRYHWLSEGVKDFVNEPHEAVCSEKREQRVLNLVAEESAGARTASAEAARQKPEEILGNPGRDLFMPRRHGLLPEDIGRKRIHRILLKTYEAQPRSFEELLGLPGVGARTVRALALVSELVFGEKASWKDPARFSFAHGGKDGIPYPVDRETYDRTIGILEESLRRAAVGPNEKEKALGRLKKISQVG